MARINGIYKCEICGDVVEVVVSPEGDLDCCGEEMKLMEEKTKEEGLEKHVPVVEVVGNKVKVKVGSVEHPMKEEHWIELIQLFKDGKLIFEKRLYPGEKPEAEFLVEDLTNIKAKELCNIHGLWRN